jgi:hypothetical protein
MDQQEPRCAGWRTSGYCDGGSCVEVAQNPLGLVAVRDNARLNGPVLLFTRAGWSEFTSHAKSNTFDSVFSCASMGK